jgi:hypothetical protein
MRRETQAMLDSILEELAVIDQAREKAEAKAMFRLLNYCPGDRDDAAALKPSSENE